MGYACAKLPRSSAQHRNSAQVGEQDIKLDMEYLKERAQNIYYGIEINPDAG